MRLERISSLRRTKCRRGPRSSIGPFRANGIFATHTSKMSRAKRVVDFAHSNLHVVSYSVPVKRLVPLAELKRHIYTLPDQPDLIPYRTSYYAENWGFCMTHRRFETLRDETYEVLIEFEP